MARGDLLPQFDEDHIDQLADAAIRQLTQQIADQLSDGSPTADRTTRPGAPPDALIRLRVLAHLSRAVERRARAEAELAALAGAGYPQLGDAWYITRQGARRRWPGLVFTAGPPTRPPSGARTGTTL